MTVDDIIKRASKLIMDAYELGVQHGKAGMAEHEQPTEVIRKKDAANDDGFDGIWAAYGHKVGKASAQKAWRRLKPVEKDLAMAAVGAYVARTDPNGADGKRFRAHLATWLNGRRWEDEEVAAIRSGLIPITNVLTLE